MWLYLSEPARLTDVDCADWQRFLPPERREKAARYSHAIDRKLCVLSYVLLRYGLWRAYAIPPTAGVPFGYSAHGKPFLRDYPAIHFNLSHCREGVACALSGSSVGVDIAPTGRDYEKAAKYACHDNELEKLKAAYNPHELFAAFWALKESYVKMKGTGVWDSLRTLDFSDAPDGDFHRYGCCFSIVRRETFVTARCHESEPERAAAVTLDALQSFSWTADRGDSRSL